MKFCSKCGKQIMDEAVICVHCGCQVASVNNTTSSSHSVNSVGYPEESKTLSTCAIVFSFLIPILGFILGIIGACRYKTDTYKSTCVGAIFVSIGVWIISFVLLTFVGM